MFLVSMSVDLDRRSVVAQLVERLAVNEDVTGSSPVHGALTF